MNTIEELTAQLRDFAQSIVEVDKTPRYEYSPEEKDEYGNDRYHNNRGEAAGAGQRWKTPKEMAQQLLRGLAGETQRSTHQQSILD